MDINNVLVVNFSVSERTTDLSEYCFRKLGLNKFITLKGANSFRDKFLQFSNIACTSKYDYFLRTDADRLLFDGVYKLISESQKDDTLLCMEGRCYDFLMKKYRYATPHLFSLRAMKMLNENNSLMPDSQKPESRFIENITKNKTAGWRLVDCLTNLHDYEQYPSKVCNTLINRIFRNHFNRLYDINYLLQTEYAEATREAIIFSQKTKEKNTMKYLNFLHLDKNFSPINKSDIDDKYNFYKQTYERLK
jgi:hypothetical protein